MPKRVWRSHNFTIAYPSRPPVLKVGLGAPLVHGVFDRPVLVRPRLQYLDGIHPRLMSPFI